MATMDRWVIAIICIVTNHVGPCATLSATTDYDQTHYHEVPGNLSLRKTIFDITDQCCGSNGFCNKDLATQPGSYCFICSKCRCDPECLLYGDCCPDLIFETEDLTVKPSEYISCLDQHLKGKTNDGLTPIFMYSTCRKGFTNRTIQRKCEIPSKYSIDEVTLVSSGNETYRNKYCAMCHSKHSYTAWRRTVKCQPSNFSIASSDTNELWKFALDYDGCNIDPSIPIDIQTRPCQTELIDKCNTTDILVVLDPISEQLCGLYYHPVLYNTLLYKNIFCAICNGAVLYHNTKCVVNRIFDRNFEVSYPISVLIDFNPKPKKQFTGSKMSDVLIPDVQCNATTIYEPVSRSCQDALCSFGRVLSEGECQVTFESSSGLGYAGSVSLKYPQTLPSSAWIDILNSYTEKLKEYLGKYRPFILPEVRHGVIVKPELHRFKYQSPSNYSKVVSGRIDFHFISTHLGDQQSLEDRLRKAHELEITFIHRDQNHSLTTQPILCSNTANGDLILIKHYLTPSYKLCGKYCKLENVSFVPITSLMPCSFLEYNLSMSNLTFNTDNSSLKVDNQTFELTNHQFWACGDILRICRSTLLTIEKRLITKQISHAENNLNQNSRVSVSSTLTLVSIVCIVISLVCLFLTFITYCLLHPLRTLPGKNTMVLVFYLFFAQLFFQIGIKFNYNQKLCQAMGVLIHYLWVATFTSMGVCAFHMYRVLTKMVMSNPAIDDSKTFVFYLMVINLVPLVVIVICVAYHMGLSRGMENGYGGDICFLQLPMDIGIFFAAPIGIILVFNIFCFIRVIMTIRSVPDMRMTSNRANRNHVNVYFRLSSLLGFTWIFGFIASATQFESLWYAFVVLNSLQGMFLFMAYCVNRRVWCMLKDTCSWKPSEDFKTTTSSLPTTTAFSPERDLKSK